MLFARWCGSRWSGLHSDRSLGLLTELGSAPGMACRPRASWRWSPPARSGVGEVEETVADLIADGAVEPVVVCGRNDALRQKLEDAGVRHVFGWVDDMAGLMRARDVVVQNAGGSQSRRRLPLACPC